MATTSRPPAPPAPRRLFLVDGMAHIFRAYYAIRNLTDSQGHPTNAVYGFAAMLRKLIRQHRPDYLAVIFDSEQPTFRHEAFEQYKANRPRMPEDLASQLPAIREFCQAMRIPILQMNRFEADDLIGTLARQATENRWETTIVSNDKDMFQLVNDRTRVLHQSKTDTLFDAARVEEFFGVAPERVVDVLGLMGDSVDNVPGAPGIGGKGARDLVRRFGSLEALLAQSEQVARKTYREALQNHRDQILQSKELVTIDTAVPIDFSWETLQLQEPDLDRLRTLLAELGFQSMLKEMGGGVAPARTEAADFQPLDSPHQLQALLDQARSAPCCTCWLEPDPEDSLCRSVRRLAVMAGGIGLDPRPGRWGGSRPGGSQGVLGRSGNRQGLLRCQAGPPGVEASRPGAAGTAGRRHAHFLPAATQSEQPWLERNRLRPAGRRSSVRRRSPLCGRSKALRPPAAPTGNLRSGAGLRADRPAAGRGPGGTGVERDSDRFRRTPENVGGFRADRRLPYQEDLRGGRDRVQPEFAQATRRGSL